MPDEEIVTPQENAGTELAQEMIQDQKIEIANEIAQDDLPKEDHVPLSKFIKERKKRQEAEQRAMQFEKQKQQVERCDSFLHFLLQPVLLALFPRCELFHLDRDVDDDYYFCCFDFLFSSCLEQSRSDLEKQE